MTRWAMVAAVLAAALLMAGCISVHRHEVRPERVVYVNVPAPTTAAAMDRAELEARYDLAMGIWSASDKDHALARVAEMAALQGDVEMTQKCLRGMWSVSAKDAAAENAAMIFARRGEMHAAREMVRMMWSTGRRDATLSKLATM